MNTCSERHRHASVDQDEFRGTVQFRKDDTRDERPRPAAQNRNRKSDDNKEDEAKKKKKNPGGFCS